MAKDTKIAWCDSTVNPVVGCDGCELHRAGAKDSYCYAAGLVGRYVGLPGWPRLSFDNPEFFAGRIEKACRWSDMTGTERPDKTWLNGYPRIIFLGDLADIFTESLALDWLAPYLTAMAAAPHIWIVCTKRPARARLFFEQYGCPRNFWLLTTVTRATTLGRVAELLRIDAPVRGISAEPLLGPLDLTRIHRNGDSLDALTGEVCSKISGCICEELRPLDWVIVGGASGRKASPLPWQWPRDIRDQCADARTPFFMKQMGRGEPIPQDLLVREMPNVR